MLRQRAADGGGGASVVAEQVPSSLASCPAAQRGGGGGGGRGAERLTRTLVHAGPSLYGAALTTVGAALPLLFCYVVVFRQMGEFISVCTCFSFAVALTLIAPAVCVAADVAAACRRTPWSAGGHGSAIARPKPATSASLAGTLAAWLRRRSPRRKVDVANFAAGSDGLPGSRRTSGSSSWSSSSKSACPPDVGSARLDDKGGTALSEQSGLANAAFANIWRA